MNWQCSACAEESEAGFDVCWNCGTGRDRSPPAPGFGENADGTEPGARDLDCLRCTTPMRFGGRKRFHEGTRAWPLLFGDLGELFVNRELFEVYACPNCGKVEFFMAPSSNQA